MEEIVQELLEQGILVRDGVGTGLVLAHSECLQGVPLHIPTTVQGVLAARIDRLAPDEKALLQQLAVIGREFPVSLIRQVIPSPKTNSIASCLASTQRVSLRATRVSRSGVYLQACADAGSRLQHGAAGAA